ncbi:MAG: hypothetical protein V7L05_05990 [Nostoc sp.]|uniref:hypothetical protein n=1 Tax=Nostoc sp. TaxID=1180 RepID=UPI002FF73610
MKFRNLVLKLHSSIGIVMGLLLMVISFSGASIVFHEELLYMLIGLMPTVLLITGMIHLATQAMPTLMAKQG